MGTTSNARTREKDGRKGADGRSDARIRKKIESGELGAFGFYLYDYEDRSSNGGVIHPTSACELKI